jgi:hypothetical protein
MYLYSNYISEFIFEPTKYSKYYFLIIECALKQSRTKLKKDNPSYVYYENHHILPESLFKNYSNLKENPWNSVLLTAREHYLVHALIWKHFKSLNHSNVYKMARAFNKMRYGDKNQERYSSKLYEYCKIHHKNETAIGIPRTDETKEKISNSKKGKPFSDTHIANIRLYHSTVSKEERRKRRLGKYHSSETKDKIRQLNLGKKSSEETKKKMSNSKFQMSQEKKDNILNATRKRVIIKGIEYDSVTTASKILDVSRTSLYEWIRNPLKEDCYKID